MSPRELRLLLLVLLAIHLGCGAPDEAASGSLTVFCGSASNALEEALGSLTVSQSVDHLRVHQGDGVSEMLSTSLGTGAFVASELEVHAEGAVHRVAWVTSSRAALGVFKLTHGQLRTST